MSIITGTIDGDGAAVNVLIGVSRLRRVRLLSVGHPVPPEIPLRVQIDTGSHVTAFLPSVFDSLGIEKFRSISVRTPSTRPKEAWDAKQYDVSVTLVSGMNCTTIPHVYAIASDDFAPEENVQGIIGRDILAHCSFEYHGKHNHFRLFF